MPDDMDQVREDAGRDRVAGEAEGQAAFDRNLFVAEVGSEMARVGNGRRTVGIKAEDEAGGEAVLAAAEHALVHGGKHFAGALRVVGEGADRAYQ